MEKAAQSDMYCILEHAKDFGGESCHFGKCQPKVSVTLELLNMVVKRDYLRNC